MKIITSSIALLVAAFTISAQAQTGRPSEAPSDRPDAVAYGEGEGSYARYLMLNGKTRERAVQEAANIDHPEPSKHFALRTVRKSSKPAVDDQTAPTAEVTQ